MRRYFILMVLVFVLTSSVASTADVDHTVVSEEFYLSNHNTDQDAHILMTLLPNGGLVYSYEYHTDGQSFLNLHLGSIESINRRDNITDLIGKNWEVTNLAIILDDSDYNFLFVTSHKENPENSIIIISDMEYNEISRLTPPELIPIKTLSNVFIASNQFIVYQSSNGSLIKWTFQGQSYLYDINLYLAERNGRVSGGGIVDPTTDNVIIFTSYTGDRIRSGDRPQILLVDIKEKMIISSIGYEEAGNIIASNGDSRNIYTIELYPGTLGNSYVVIVHRSYSISEFREYNTNQQILPTTRILISLVVIVFLMGLIFQIDRSSIDRSIMSFSSNFLNYAKNFNEA